MEFGLNSVYDFLLVQHRVRLGKYKRDSDSLQREGENLQAAWSPDAKLIAILVSLLVYWYMIGFMQWMINFTLCLKYKSAVEFIFMFLVLYIHIFHLQTSAFFLHIFKVQLSDKRIHTGGKQPSALCLATVSLLLTEQVPFAVKDLSV